MARRGSTRRKRMILGVGIALLFAGYLLWALRTEETFRVVNKTLEQTDAGIVVAGEVYNVSSSAASVHVEVSFFGHDGRKLAEDIVTLHNVAAGASAPFRTQPKKLQGVTEYSLYLHAGRNMYGN
ncbi:MAG TPA: FxLYD domain-containing protein [Methylomirabilota bacterium]|nr:FxLYD domain-containing protein [Methylomirabilota bacterium]